MDKYEVIDKFKEFLKASKVVSTELWMCTESSLLMHGLQDGIARIDLGCNKYTLDILKRTLGKQAIAVGRSEGFIYDNMQVIQALEFDIDIVLEPVINRRANLVTIDGVQCYNLPMITKHKEIMGLEKDKPMLAKIARIQKSVAFERPTYQSRFQVG